MGLQSSDFDRYSTAINSLENLKENNDLDIMAAELLQVVFRAQNKFETEGFLEKKYKGLVQIIKLRPVEALQEIG